MQAGNDKAPCWDSRGKRCAEEEKEEEEEETQQAQLLCCHVLLVYDITCVYMYTYIYIYIYHIVRCCQRSISQILRKSLGEAKGCCSLDPIKLGHIPSHPLR